MSSVSSFRCRLPSPESWRPFDCARCDAEMRLPFRPSDGLCPTCRRAAITPVEKTVEERLAAAGAPPRYAVFTRASWERRYGAWDEHVQLRRLIGWPRETREGSWLLFVTSPSYGDRKTGLATAVLGEALAHGLAGRWVSQSVWLRRIKASWNGGEEPEHVVWSSAADAPVLLFDDLGGVEGAGGPGKAWWRTQVTELVHYREAHGLPTIVTASLADWREVRLIHESLLSRMDVPLKIALPSGRDYRSEERRALTPGPSPRGRGE